MEIVDVLEQEGLTDSTLRVVTSDHGEEFGQHGRYGHGTNLYEESVRIPLLFHSPALLAGGASSALTDLTDVAPSILGLLGLAPPPQWDGRNLFGDPARQAVYLFAGDTGSTLALREGDRKHVWTISTDRVETYDLTRDPEERHDIAADVPDLALCAKQALANWVRERKTRTPPTGSLPPE